MIQLLICIFFIAAFSVTSKANVCGPDFQNFNPTSSNLNFVTVHSSNTLEPCVMNMGIFIDYAINTLTYTSNTSTKNVDGNRAKNSLLSANVAFGLGLTQEWDAGISFPAMLAQEVKEDIGASTFSRPGINEFRLDTKYRFLGSRADGVAGVFSFSQNTIEDNPFAGRDAGPSYILELVGDSTLTSNLSVAGNLGYKKRSPGKVVPNQPFLPMKDQWIYSAAIGYLVPNGKTKFILEYYSALPAVKTDQDTNKNLNSSEINFGMKHRYSRRGTLHLGIGSKLFNSFGAPDFRVYSGLTWLLGPVCGTATPNDTYPSKNYSNIEPVAPPGTAEPLPPINYEYDYFRKNDPISSDPPEVFEPIKKSTNEREPDVYRFDANVLFSSGSSFVAENYRKTLARFAAQIKKQGFVRIGILGFTDSVGRASYNKDLSEKRAQSVKNLLVEYMGIPSDKITTEGWGMENPIATNETEQGKRRNRRVEIQIWK